MTMPVRNVRYILVVPKDEPENWELQFPAGWNEACKVNDHRSDVNCLEIFLSQYVLLKRPISMCSYSRLNKE
jgi:hypothetical protein